MRCLGCLCGEFVYAEVGVSEGLRAFRGLSGCLGACTCQDMARRQLQRTLFSYTRRLSVIIVVPWVVALVLWLMGFALGLQYMYS